MLNQSTTVSVKRATFERLLRDGAEWNSPFRLRPCHFELKLKPFLGILREYVLSINSFLYPLRPVTRFPKFFQPYYHRNDATERQTPKSIHSLRCSRISTMDSALCDCKEAEQTIHHILQDCPVWRKQRHQLWPQDESTTSKLWGTAEDLRRTTQFLAACGLRV